MSPVSLKFSDFVDMVLVRLYETDRLDSDQLANLASMQKEIKSPVPMSWFIDAAKVLQARSLADCMFNSKGVFAHITGEGRLYVERGEGTTGEIKRNEGNYYNLAVAGDQNQIIVGPNGSAKQSMSVGQAGHGIPLVEAIKEKIQKDSSLDTPAKEQALRYVKIVRGEAQKDEPNRNIVAAVLEPLSQIDSVADQVANLIKFFNG